MAKTDTEALNMICLRKLVAVVRCDSEDQLLPIADALIDGGIDVIEVTMTVPDAIRGLRGLVNYVRSRAIVGAGTVLEQSSCVQAIEAGASFIVSPCFIPGVVKSAVDRGILAVPGCFSPTEVLVALEMGAPLVKLFPASVLGPKFIREMHGPFPALKTMPTGGIDIDNIDAFFAAGANAVGLGGHLVDKAAIARGDFAAITEHAAEFRAAVGE
ncbi:MAG: bifunctional 4-hydroxy-2-oxoglutarate aldolase/2-dehydro-3-deoxy-phosphogluconate aldolase [Bacillota bacterium]